MVLGTDFGRTRQINDNDGRDHHNQQFTCLLAGGEISGGEAVLDQTMIALLADFNAKGLLNQTLVVLSTEFGNRQRINDNDGRDHRNKAFACLMARAWDHGWGGSGQHF